MYLIIFCKIRSHGDVRNARASDVSKWSTGPSGVDVNRGTWMEKDERIWMRQIFPSIWPKYLVAVFFQHTNLTSYFTYDGVLGHTGSQAQELPDRKFSFRVDFFTLQGLDLYGWQSSFIPFRAELHQEVLISLHFFVLRDGKGMVSFALRNMMGGFECVLIILRVCVSFISFV